MRPHLSRGLAATAVGALAATGLTCALPSPAGAAGPGVAFVSLYNQGNDASVRFDGADGAISLVAQRLDPSVTGIAFEVNTNPAAGDTSPGWTAIPGAPTVLEDLVSLRWTPDGALAGQQVAVRAVATAPSGTTYSTRHGVVIARGEWGTESVSAVRSFFSSGNLGYFTQPYVDSGRTATHAAVHGFTSANSGTVQVGWWDPANQSFRGKVDAVVRPTELKVSPGNYVPGGGDYAADLDISAFGAAPGDAIAVGAELDTDEVNLTQLSAQTVTSLTANAQDAAAGQPTPVTIAVYDGSGGAIAGAEVRRLPDSSLVGYTDGDGQVHDIGIDGALVDYYVNTTDVDAYEAGTDVTAPTGAYSPDPTAINPVLLDGRVFDDDEYAAGDVAIQVTDNYRLAIPGADVEYRVYPTGTTPPAVYATASSDAQGRARIAFAPQGPDGSYTLDFHLPAESDQTITFTAGDAGLVLTPAAGAAAPGGQVQLSGALSIGGVPLSNRRVAATYTRGVELVPGTTADAALVDGAARVLSLTASTDPLGLVTYVVDDPDEKPQGAETGGKIALSTLPAAAGGVALSGNPAEAAAGTTTFGTTKGKAKVRLKGSSAGPKDRLVVKGPDSVRGERVTLFRVVGGKLKKVTTKKLGRKGDTVLKVQDTNGDAPTTYVVKLLSSNRVKGSKSKKLTLE